MNIKQIAEKIENAGGRLYLVGGAVRDKILGIENFDEVNDYIIKSGLDVESACIRINLSLEQIDIIKLIYARDYFIDGDYENGNKLLSEVEDSKIYCDKIFELYDDIREL